MKLACLLVLVIGFFSVRSASAQTAQPLQQVQQRYYYPPNTQQFSGFTSTNVMQYSYKINQEQDRVDKPFTAEDCASNPRFKLNRSCYLSQNDKPMLKAYSQQYMKESINKWTKVESADNLNSDPYTDSIISRIHVFSTNPRKRKAIQKYNMNNDNENTLLTRSKRDIPGNPCTRGPAKRTIITEAIHAVTGKPVELFQNPDESLFQTFFVRSCHISKFYSLFCEITYVDYVAAAYEGKGLTVKSVPVRIPTSCALSVGRYF